MADLSVTASSVALVSGTNLDVSHNAGEALTAGQNVFLNVLNLWMRGSANTAGKMTVGGVCMVDVATGTPAVVALKGCIINTGATITKGTHYFQSSTLGKQCPFADVTTGWAPNSVYQGTDTANALITAINPNITL